MAVRTRVIAAMLHAARHNRHRQSRVRFQMGEMEVRKTKNRARLPEDGGKARGI